MTRLVTSKNISQNFEVGAQVAVHGKARLVALIAIWLASAIGCVYGLEALMPNASYVYPWQAKGLNSTLLASNGLWPDQQNQRKTGHHLSLFLDFHTGLRVKRSCLRAEP